MRLSIATRSAEIPVPAESAFAVADALEDIRPATETRCSAEARASKGVAALALPCSAIRDLVFVGGAILIVELAFLFVGKDLVRLVDFLELRLVAARIRVVLAGQFAKCLLDGIGIGVTWNA